MKLLCFFILAVLVIKYFREAYFTPQPTVALQPFLFFLFYRLLAHTTARPPGSLTDCEQYPNPADCHKCEYRSPNLNIISLNLKVSMLEQHLE